VKAFYFLSSVTNVAPNPVSFFSSGEDEIIRPADHHSRPSKTTYLPIADCSSVDASVTQRRGQYYGKCRLNSRFRYEAPLARARALYLVVIYGAGWDATTLNSAENRATCAHASAYREKRHCTSDREIDGPRIEDWD